jgi:hypothetical protein
MDISPVVGLKFQVFGHAISFAYEFVGRPKEIRINTKNTDINLFILSPYILLDILD